MMLVLPRNLKIFISRESGFFWQWYQTARLYLSKGSNIILWNSIYLFKLSRRRVTVARQLIFVEKTRGFQLAVKIIWRFWKTITFGPYRKKYLFKKNRKRILKLICLFLSVRRNVRSGFVLFLETSGEPSRHHRRSSETGMPSFASRRYNLLLESQRHKTEQFDETASDRE